MTNDSKNLASLNKDILAALATESKDALRKVMQSWLDNEIKCIEADHQEFVQELIKKYDGRFKFQVTQADLTDFFNKKYTEFSKTINEIQTHFSDQIEKQYQNLESYKHIPFLYEREKKALKTKLKCFFQQLKNFEKNSNKHWLIK